MRTPLTPDTAQVGMFVDARLVTDTEVWEIIAKTAKTITIRDCHQLIGSDGHPLMAGTWPHVEYAITSNPDGFVQTLRFRKDGTFRLARWARPLYPAHLQEFPDGNRYPTEYRDWSF